jgi:Nucleoside-diphosphate-sugar pyrophosphorylase involved in lipopolysaccharide biosynthesis/translation initiation factor 2B, gamma/epsilon subunits (eIF-2Bgamma/eIF-2Bepsilon)
MKAMILAAGFGTRLKPLTDTLPKPLIPYKSKPMICYQIENLKAAGADEIIVNTHYFSGIIKQFFEENDFGIPVTLSYEENILGTGGGIINAKQFLSKSDYCIITNTDIISDFKIDEIVSAHLNSKRDVTLLVQNRTSKRFLAFDKDMNFKGRFGNSAAGDAPYAFNGVHIISKSFFDIPHPGGFSDIIDLYISNINRLTIKGYDADGSTFLDIGKIENL